MNMTSSTPTLQASSLFTTQTLPKRTSQIGDAYVLQIARTASHYAASASAPKNSIHLFDRSTLSLVHTLQGHESGISALAVSSAPTGSVAGDHALFSCGKDARVKVWDERTGDVALESMSFAAIALMLSTD
jgi:WD40 repeat protein